MVVLMIDWEQIDTVLLDMDGTLLDLHFDNHFWLEYVPQRYAEVRDIPVEQARVELLGRYNDILGTLKWYCVDHWSRELELDIALLKEEVSHLIAVHPHVVDFLEALRAAGKRVVLVTNAHQKSLALKMEKTQLRGYFDKVISAHDLGYAKEEQAFWRKLQEVEPFNSRRTLFVDDSISVLRSAEKYGIRWLLAILSPDSKQSPHEPQGFLSVHDFSEVMPSTPDYPEI